MVKCCQLTWRHCQEKKKMDCCEAYLQTKKRQDFPYCEAATNHRLQTELQSSSNLQASMSPWEPDTALFMSASATGIYTISVPNSELPAWKNRKGETDEESCLPPSQPPSQSQMVCVRAGRFCFVSRTLACFSNFRISGPFQTKNHLKQPTINYSHTQQPLRDGFTHYYVTLPSEFYTDLRRCVYGSRYDPAVTSSPSTSTQPRKSSARKRCLKCQKASGSPD